MSKRKASDSPDIEHSSTESGVVPSSSKSSSKKKKTLSPDEVIAKALKKVSSSEAPSAKSVQQMLTRATVVGEEVMRETTGGMKPKTSKKGKGKAKADESEVQTRLVESIGMIILGLEVNPIFQEQVKAGVRDDGALAVWVPFFQTQKDLNAQVTAMTDQELLKPLPLCDSITPTTTHDELTELLREYFPSVFDNLDRLAIGRPACKYAPFVLCSKIPKGGYQPLQRPYPDGAAIARLFGKRGSNVERRVFFATREQLDLEDVNPDYIAGRQMLAQEPSTEPTPPAPIIVDIPDQLTDDDEIQIMAGPSQLLLPSTSDRILRPRSGTSQYRFHESDDEDGYEIVEGLFDGDITPTSVTAVGTRSPSPTEAIEARLSQSLSFVLDNKPDTWQKLAEKKYTY